MAIRMIEVYLGGKDAHRVRAVLREQQFLGIWPEKLDGETARTRVLLKAEDSEVVLDLLEKKFAGEEGFRIVILPVEATFPRPEPDEEPQPKTEAGQSDEKAEVKPDRISREELYADIEETIRVSPIFVVLVILSSIVSAIGMIENNAAIIIGAMVIAPLLGPNVAVSLATTLGDFPLARRAAKAGLTGVAVAFSCAIVMGWVLPVSPDIPEIASRTKVGLGDIVLALAAGSAGALSFTAGLPGTLIGVMVAVAFLPPLVAFGMLIGAGYIGRSLGALELLLVNIISINLAGVITFLAQGIRPKTWWEAERAKKATWKAIALWLILLTVLAAVIILSQKGVLL